MSVSEDEDERLVQFLESVVLSETSDQEVVKTENEDEADEGPQRKRPRLEDETHAGEEANSTRSASSIQVQDPSPSRKIRIVSTSSSCDGGGINNNRENPRRIDTGIFSKVPPELYHHILKFLSSEDLVACSLAADFSVLLLLMKPCGVDCIACDGVCYNLQISCGIVPGKSFTFSVMKKTWLSLLEIAPLSSKSITSKCRQQREAKPSSFSGE